MAELVQVPAAHELQDNSYWLPDTFASQEEKIFKILREKMPLDFKSQTQNSLQLLMNCKIPPPRHLCSVHSAAALISSFIKLNLNLDELKREFLSLATSVTRVKYCFLFTCKAREKCKIGLSTSEIVCACVVRLIFFDSSMISVGHPPLL